MGSKFSQPDSSDKHEEDLFFLWHFIFVLGVTPKLLLLLLALSLGITPCPQYPIWFWNWTRVGDIQGKCPTSWTIAPAPSQNLFPSLSLYRSVWAADKISSVLTGPRRHFLMPFCRHTGCDLNHPRLWLVFTKTELVGFIAPPWSSLFLGSLWNWGVNGQHIVEVPYFPILQTPLSLFIAMSLERK